MSEYNIYVNKKIYSKDDFHIYVGIINHDDYYNEEISIKTNGFELSSENGKKILIGEMGEYQGKKSLKVNYEKSNYDDPEIQKGILLGVKGVGEDKVNNILNSLDNNLFNLLKYNDEDLENLKIKGFGKKTFLPLVHDIRDVIRDIKNNFLLTELQAKLHDSIKGAKIIELANSIDSIEELYNAPYEALIDIIELSFSRADDIALNKLNIDINHPQRLCYLIANILKKTIRGNTYCEKDNFIEILKKYNINNLETKLMNNDQIVIDNDKCYPVKLYHSEVNTANHIYKFLQHSQDSFKYDLQSLKKYIKMAEDEFSIRYDNSQKNAIITVINNNISCLIGGAGVGKSSVLKAVIFVLRQIGLSMIKCVAPTGKASRRLFEATRHVATTIHSYIHQDERIYDVLIVDEFSMCDLQLLSKVFEKSFNRIIFSGDDEQLQSVQPGNNLYDMIESGLVPIAKLTKVHRQASNSNILDCAYAVRNNQPISTAFKEKDFYFQKCITTKDFFRVIDKMYLHLKDKFENDIDFYNNVQIIAPMRKGNLGCNNINKYIQEKYNDNKIDKWLNFKVNDKVMNIKNDRTRDIFNGECGIIKTIKTAKIKNKMVTTFSVYFSNIDRTILFDSSDKSNFQLAYASTVHKLQGSEYKYIILVIENDSIFLDSKILYTGITRGKETVIVLSQLELYNKISKRNNKHKRKTYLKERIQDKFNTNSVKEDTQKELLKESH